ncbi:MAG: nucleoside triphosphate pyrophosphatase [Lautropia sp.]
MIYLASRSPRRLELLAQLGIECRLLLDDDAARAEALEHPIAGEAPAAYVLRVATAKARAALTRLAGSGLPRAPILAADTTVALGGTLFGKPLDRTDARRMLERLSGRTHRVLTAVVVADTAGKRLHAATQISRVRFARLRAAELADYVASGEPDGKAGGYAIQGRAAAFVRRIEGSYSGIMGLPLHETAHLLRRAGYTGPASGR